MNGVFLDDGASDFQIFQQAGGFADLSLRGHCRFLSTGPDYRVYVRAVREETGEEAVSWTPAEMAPADGREGTCHAALRLPAGGLYRLETCLCGDRGNIDWAVRGDMVHHIGAGEVFVIAGQSNAAGYGKTPAFDPPELGVHLLRNCGRWDIASHPFNDTTGSVHEENAEFANPGSSPFLAFGKRLKRKLGRPVGFIEAALGGSPLSLWNPEQNGRLYRMLLGLLAGRRVRAVLWYQGESDCAEVPSRTYFSRFETMVSRLRRDTGDPALPFLTVQLNRDLRAGAEKADAFWGAVREAQRQAARRIPNVFITQAADLTLSDVLHNSSESNVVLGARLAALALETLYGKGSGSRCPDLESARRIPGGAALTFCHAGTGLVLPDIGTPPFSLSDAAGPVGIRKVSADGCRIFLETGRTPGPGAAVSLAWGANPQGPLPVRQDTGLPALAFFRVPVEETGESDS